MGSTRSVILNFSSLLMTLHCEVKESVWKTIIYLYSWNGIILLFPILQRESLGRKGKGELTANTCN